MLKSKFRHFINLWLKSNEGAITLKYIPQNSTYTYHVTHLHPASHLILFFTFNLIVTLKCYTFCCQWNSLCSLENLFTAVEWSVWSKEVCFTITAWMVLSPCNRCCSSFAQPRNKLCSEQNLTQSSFSAMNIWVCSRGDHGAGVDYGRSLRFLPKLEQNQESDFWIKTRPRAGVRNSVFTGFGQLILLNLNFLW